MLAILMALGAVSGLVALAIAKTTGPLSKEHVERKRLSKLKTKATVSLDEAEDGAVLARRYKDVEAERRFDGLVRKLRARRVSI